MKHGAIFIFTNRITNHRAKLNGRSIMKPRHILIATVLAIVFAGSQTLEAAQDTSKILWQRDAGEKLTYFRLVDDTLLLTGTESGLECRNASDGGALWSSPVVDSVRGWSAGHIKGTPNLLMLRSQSRTIRASKFHGGGLITVRNNELTVMNVHKGRALWSSAPTGIHSVVGYYPTPDSTKLILITADTARTRSIRCVDFQTDELIWVNDSAYLEKGPELIREAELDSLTLGQQQPIFDSDSTMITFIAKGIVRKWNWLTGAVIWESELRRKELAPLSLGFMPMQLDKDGTRLYVPANKYLFCLDSQTGDVLWESPKMYGHVYQMERTRHGLLVRGGYFKSDKGGYKDYMILLDPETGGYRWDKQLTKFKTPRTSNFVTFGDEAYIYSDRKLYEVSIQDGAYAQIADKMDVRGNIRLYKYGHLIRLISGETVAIMSKDATMVFNSTHELPKSGGFWSTLGTIVAIAAVIAVAAQAGSGAYGDGGGFVYVPPVSYGLTRYSELAVASDSSICMVTDVKSGSEKGPGIVRVRFSDGEILGSALIGDKSPDYTFSESLSMLYVVEDDSKITAFRF